MSKRTDAQKAKGKDVAAAQKAKGKDVAAPPGNN